MEEIEKREAKITRKIRAEKRTYSHFLQVAKTPEQTKILELYVRLLDDEEGIIHLDANRTRYFLEVLHFNNTMIFDLFRGGVEKHATVSANAAIKKQMNQLLVSINKKRREKKTAKDTTTPDLRMWS